VGPASGIHARGGGGHPDRTGKNILVAAEPDEFAAQVVRVLKDRALNEALRTAGRAWVEANYASQAVYRRMDEVYAQLPDRRKARSRDNTTL